MSGQGLQDVLRFPVPLVCPECRDGALRAEGSAVTCGGCDAAFTIENGIADLIIGDRFPDEIEEEELCYEDECIRDATNNYWQPTFRKHLADTTAPRQVLSMGCGTGSDIDILTDAGLSTVGIDNGNRTRLWKVRKYSNRLLLANGLHMPFRDDTFDVIYCGCVFPHIGVVGDSYEVTATYLEERQRLADEMARVAKPGAHLFMASPNRLFPLDLFHGRTKTNHLPRNNLARSPFLLSEDDYRELFLRAGCASAAAIPSQGYWGFLRSGRSWKGRLSSLPVRGLFKLTSAVEGWEGSALNPWIVVHIRMPS